MKIYSEFIPTDIAPPLFIDVLSANQDKLYREPSDGTISLRNNNLPAFADTENDAQPLMDIPDLELVTLIDISSLWEKK